MAEHVCLVLRFKRRVIHWHWPRADIVDCENSKADDAAHTP